MFRPTILAVAFMGFVIPAIADEGDGNGPRMKLFLWDGGYYLETRPQHMKEPGQNGEKIVDGLDKGKPEKKGQKKTPKGKK